MPRRIELEIAKFLGTIGFADYGKALWDLSSSPEEDEPVAPVASTIIRQIEAQARHDPSLLAAGPRAVPHLRRLKRTLVNCWGVTAASLLDAAQPRPSVLLVVPNLAVDTLDRAKGLLEDLRACGAATFLIVVTDQSGHTAPADAFKDLPEAKILFWRDHVSGPSEAEPRLFAMFAHAVGAPVMIGFSTRVYLETLARYGRALRRFHRLFALLEIPGDLDRRLFKDVHYLRTVAPFATILTRSDGETAWIRSFGHGIDDLRIATLSTEALPKIFGSSFDDERSAASQAVIPALLAQTLSEVSPLEPLPPRSPDRYDVTVTIVFHREGALAGPALASLADMIEVARDGGLRIEARAMLDRSDDPTRHLIQAQGGFLDDVREVTFGDLGLTRNAGTALAQGAYLAFVDGDDLWGADWLLQGYRAAVAGPAAAIWHPTSYYLFLGSDCGWSSETDRPHPRARSSFYDHQSCADPDFDTRELLLENLWTANAFARTDVYRRFPYRANDWAEQAGIEDWRWNLETLGAGIPHLIVPDTVHLVREKEAGSLGQRSDGVGLLPILS